MSLVGVDGRRSNSFFQPLISNLESKKNSLIRKIRSVTAPMSLSLPFYYFINLFNKAIKLQENLSGGSFLPLVGKSIEGMSDIARLGNFIFLTTGLFPHISQKRIDVAALEKSITLPQEILEEKRWKKRIVKQVKISAETRNTLSSIRQDIAAMVARKAGKDKLEAETLTHLQNSVNQLTIRLKDKPTVEKVYTAFFFTSGVCGVVKTLNKWQLINLSKISLKIGNSKAIKITSKIVGSKITRSIALLGISEIGKIATLIGSTIKITYDSYQLCHLQQRINKAEDAEEISKLKKERAEKIWTISLIALSIIGTLIPLVLSVNPIVLLTYEIAVLSLGLLKIFICDQL